MALGIYLKSKTVTQVTDELTGFEIALAVEDDVDGTPVNAQFSLNADTPIMCGITTYGRITGLLNSYEMAETLHIFAETLDGVGVGRTKSIAAILAYDVGEPVIDEDIS